MEKGSVSYYSKQVFPRVYIAIIIMYMNSGKNLRKSSYIVENERLYSKKTKMAKKRKKMTTMTKRNYFALVHTY